MQFEFLRNIKIKNKLLDDFMKHYSYYVISTELTQDIKNQISNIFEQSDFLMINYFEPKENKENGYFIICFNFTIIIVMKQYLNNFTGIFSAKNNLDIYFLEKAKEKFNLNISYKEKKFNEILKSGNIDIDINYFNNNLKIKNEIWNNYITPCISEYLIMASYQKNKNRLFDFFNNKNQFKKQDLVNDNEYIKIGNVGKSTSFSADLIYHIEKQLLLVIKFPIGSEHLNTINIETNYYTNNQLLFPFLPKFFGKSSEGYIIMEYIKGKRLDKIKDLGLNDDDKLRIIVKLILTIFYLHSNRLIYTDLKPNNIIIDMFKNPVLIDFDKMISSDDENSSLKSRNFLANNYLPPEDIPYYESDVYSLGKLIYFIMSGKEPGKENNVKIEDFGTYPELFEIYLNCTNENYQLRPNLIAILFKLNINNDLDNIVHYSDLLNLIINKLKQSENTYIDQYLLRCKCFMSIYRDENHFCQIKPYLNTAFSQAYFLSAYIYMKEDRKKSINFLEDAIKKGLANGEIYYLLGYIYYFFDDVCDIKKSIEYLKTAAKQNDSNSLFYLGYIYYYSKNINEAKNYLEKAIKYNNKNAFCLLGLIYFKTKNISEAIKYFKQASKKNHKAAELILYLIYHDGIFVNQDLNEARKYWIYDEIFIFYFCKVDPSLREKLDLIQSNHFFEFNLDLIFEILELIDEKSCIEISINLIIQLAKKEEGAILFLPFVYYYQVIKTKNGISYIPKNYYIEPDPTFGLTINKFVEFSLKNSEISKKIEDTVISLAEKSPILQFILWNIYLFIDEIFDFPKAFKYLQLSANNKDPFSNFMLGYIYFAKYLNEFFERNAFLKFQELIILSITNDQQDAKKFSNFVKKILESCNLFKANINFAIKNLYLAREQGITEANNILCFIYIILEEYDTALFYANNSVNCEFFSKNCLLGFINLFSFKYNFQKEREAYKYFEEGGAQNDVMCKLALGCAYSSNGSFFYQNIQKSIQYLNNPACKCFNEVNYILAKNYEDNNDMENAINTYSFAAVNGCGESQFKLGLLYLNGKYMEQDIKKSLELFEISAKKGNIKANFAMGYFYLVGTKFFRQDISKSKNYFNYGSSMNDAYSKNNLGIIYKYGLGNPENKNIFWAETFLKEANDNSFFDSIIAYNLAHIYIYNEEICKKGEDRIQKAIDILNHSYFSYFPQIIDLLSIALILKYKNNAIKRNIFCDELHKLVMDKIISEEILFEKSIYEGLPSINQSKFDEKFEKFKHIDFLIDFPSEKAVLTSDYFPSEILKISSPKSQINYPITKYFYDGFIIDNDQKDKK